jgi:hypothetical protein
MELAGTPNDPDTDTFYKVVGTLNAAAPSLRNEEQWRYFRAVVTTPGSAAIQVGYYSTRHG